MDLNFREPIQADVRKLSVLYKQVYIQTYGTEGVSQEYADFIIEQFSEEQITARLESEEHFHLMAEHKNNPVGILEVVFGKSSPLDHRICPEINKLYILERFCHLGIGTRLMELAEKALKAQGHQHVWLWVLSSNDRAVKFYEKQQYQRIGTSGFQMTENLYCNTVMTKTL